MCARSQPEMSSTASNASTTASAYASRPQSRCSARGLRQEIAKTSCPLCDQVLDVTAPRREIHDVELVDHRRHEEDRNLPHLRGRRLVLDELEALVAEDDGSRGQADVAADDELADVDVGGQARRLPHVPGELPRAAHEVPPARVDRSLEHRGIDERSVGGRQRVDDVLGDEAHLAVIRPVELGIADDPVDRVVHGEIGLQQPAVDPAGGPCGVEEPAVAARGLQLRAAGDDLRELPGQRGAAPDHPPRTAGKPRSRAGGSPGPAGSAPACRARPPSAAGPAPRRRSTARPRPPGRRRWARPSPASLCRP